MTTKKRIVLIYFTIVFMVYIIDLITTIIGLSFGAIENNPIAYNIFIMSHTGKIIGMFLFIFFWAVSMLFLVEVTYIVYKKLFDENLRTYTALLMAGLLILLYNSFMDIVNNLNVILNLIGG